MSISQEILVLDFGDDKKKQDFLRNPVEPGRTPSADFDGKNTLKFFKLILFKHLNNGSYVIN
jgi:hypothetical protein